MTQSSEALKEKKGRGHYSRAVDYSTISVPDPEKKPMTRWTAKERKAYLLQLIMQRGSSSMICRTEMAERFQISIARISQDLKALDYWIADNIDGKRVHSLVIANFTRAHQKLLEDEKYERAFNLALTFTGYLAQLGIIEKAPSRHELEVTGGLEIVFQTVQQQDSQED